MKRARRRADLGNRTRCLGPGRRRAAGRAARLLAGRAARFAAARAARFAAARAARFAALLLLAVAALSCRAEPVDTESLVETFKDIHRNIYGIYTLRDGGDVYDVLAASCTGRELEREVFEYLKCLRVQEELDTYVSIVDVIYNDVRVLAADGRGAEVYCKWIVVGKVRHPTHIHRKVNLNEALYRVALLDEGLRITGYDLLTNQAVEVSQQ